jgi:hypothetical protein
MPSDDVLTDFCREFEEKLSGDGCCLPGEGSTALPRCLGAHVRAATDWNVGSLFAVYWGAKTGRLTCHDVVGAARELRARESVPCEGLGLGDPSSAAESCMMSNFGLEFYAGAVKANYVMIDGVMATVASVAARTDGWTPVEEMCEAFSTELVEQPEEYSFIEASVGNFVTYSEDRVVKKPVLVRVCKNFRSWRANDFWLEYVDRTERLHRFDVKKCNKTLAGDRSTDTSLAASIIMDALHRGYEFREGARRLGPKQRHVTKSALHAWNGVLQAADGKDKSALLVAIMPALSDLDAIAEANDAIVGACAMHLAAKNRRQPT